MDWKIVYLDTLEEWISQLNKMQLKSLAKELKLLELCGNKIKLPHSKALGAGLFELRERKFGLRIYYTYSNGNIIILLHAGSKKSQNKDIKIAKKLLKQHKECTL
jgi:putative addiction module killer protein